VSGPTIQRWETGHSTPSHFDLLRFAQVCQLSPIETAFLIDAFACNGTGATTGSSHFPSGCRRGLSVSFPAHVFDSFFYLRAWNSYALDGPALGKWSGYQSPSRPILASTRPNESEDSEHRRWRLAQRRLKEFLSEPSEVAILPEVHWSNRFLKTV
jgi:hypothetical protein